MNELAKAMLEDTAATVRFEADSNVTSVLFCCIANTTIRAAFFYGAIRVVLTALEHGSFF